LGPWSVGKSGIHSDVADFSNHESITGVDRLASAIQHLQTSQPETKLILDKKPWMEEWARTRGCKTVARWLSLLLEAEQAAHREHELNWLRGDNEAPPKIHIEPNRKMGPLRVLTDEQENELVELFESGDANALALAERFCIGVSTVKRILRRAGAM
jgi:hypothetical protein